MDALTHSLIIGFLLASSAVWLISRLNNHLTDREEHLHQLLLKRAKKD